MNRRYGFMLAAAALVIATAASAEPFQKHGKTQDVAVTNVASTPVQLLPIYGSTTCYQVSVFNTGATDAWVEFGPTSAGTVPDIPAGGTAGTSTLVRAGTSIDIKQAVPKPYISAKTASGTTTIQAVCSSGESDGAASSAGVTSTPPTGSSSTQVQGAAAHDSPIAGNPLRGGGRAVTAAVTAVTAGDAVDLVASTQGVLATTHDVAGADNASNTHGSPIDRNGTAIRAIGVYPYSYDGSTWDRFTGMKNFTQAAVADTSFTAQAADFTVEAATANLRLMGWSIRESAAGAAVATVVIRHDADGTCDSTAVFAFIELSANQSLQQEYGDRGKAAASGVCVDVIAGTVDFVASLATEAAP